MLYCRAALAKKVLIAVSCDPSQWAMPGFVLIVICLVDHIGCIHVSFRASVLVCRSQCFGAHNLTNHVSSF